MRRQNTDHNVTVTWLKYTRNKYITYQNSKQVVVLEYILHHNGSYFLLFGKRRLLSFKVSCERFLNFKKRPPFFKRRTLKIQN